MELNRQVEMTSYFRDQLGLNSKPLARLNLSQPQHSGPGRFLGWLYYSGPEQWVGLDRDQRFGYPHNGGEHSLTIRASVAEVEQFIDWLETLKPASINAREGKDEFIRIAREKLSDEILKLNNMNG